MFSTDSPYVWISDIYHRHYPNYVKILEVLPEKKYRVRIQTSVGKDVNDGPEDILDEDQLSDQII